MKVEPNQLVFREGDIELSCVYIIKSGEFHVYKQFEKTKDKVKIS